MPLAVLLWADGLRGRLLGDGRPRERSKFGKFELEADIANAIESTATQEISFPGCWFVVRRQH